METISSYLASLSYGVTNDWLSGCISYFQTENPNSNLADLKIFVRKQWELSDLRESSNGCLPNGLSSHLKVTLTEKYALQIESVINISVPAYSQIQKIRKFDNKNVEVTEKKPESWEPRPGRMLKMSLCDGSQTVDGIEYRPLPMLDEITTPGTKVMIVGPVDCRRGVLFLKPENVKIIGGEVDSLLIKNHMENVLARVLGLPENEDPYSDTHGPPVSVEINTTSIMPTSTNNQNQPMRPPTQISSISTSTQQTYQANTTVISNDAELYPEINDLDVIDWDNDDLFLGEEIDRIEERFTNSHEPRTVNSSSTSSLHDNKVEERKSQVLPAPRSNKVAPKVPSTNFRINEDNISEPPNANFGANPPPPLKNSVDTHNSFLASDEYVDSMLLDGWEDEEMIEMFNNGSSGNNVHSKQAFSSSSSISLNTPVPVVTKNTNKETFSGQNRVSASVSKEQQLFKKPESVPREQSVKRNISHWCVKTSNSSSSTTESSSSIVSAKTIFNSSVELDTNDVQSKIERKSSGCEFNSKPQSKLQSSLISNKKKMGSITKFLNISSNSSSSNALAISKDNDDNEDDWADAYRNSPLKNKYGVPNQLKTVPSITSTKMSFSSSLNTVNKPNDRKSSLPSGQGKVSTEMKCSDGIRDSIHKASTHLPAAVCSPSDIDNDLDVELVAEDFMDDTVFNESPMATMKKTSFNVNPTSTGTKPKPWICPIKAPLPFEYIIHLLNHPAKMAGIHKVKATILSLITQLKVDSDYNWELSAKICDGTGTLDVLFSSDVLDEIIGLSGREFKQMKRDVTKNPLIKEKLIKLLQKSQQTFIDLNCIFSINFEEDKMATVVKLTDLTESDINMLKLRQHST